MSKKWALVPLFVAVLAVSVFAAGPVTLNLWSHDYAPLVEQYRAMISKYESANPGVKIVYTSFPWVDFEPTLVTKLAAGSGPDLFGSWDLWFGGLLQKGVLSPVDYNALGYKSKEDMEKGFVENSLKPFSSDKDIFGVTTELNSYSLFINKKHFQEAGLNPEKDYPKTWDDVAALAKKLVKLDSSGNFVREAFDFNRESPFQEAFMSDIFYSQAGAKWLSPDGKECLLNSPQAIKAMQTIEDLIYKYKVGSPKFGNLDPLLHAADFLGGELSMSIANPAIESLAREKLGNDFMVVEVPHMKDGVRATSGYGWYWAVNNASKNKRAAWKVIDFLSSDPISWYKNLKFFQTRNPKWMSSSAAAALKSKFFDVWIEGFRIMSSPPHLPIYNDIYNANSKAYEAVLLEDADVSTVMKQATEEINSALERMQ